MKLFILERLDSVGYDEYDSFVVRAENETEARNLVGNNHYPGKIWKCQESSSCEQIKTTGETKIILGSFNAG